MNKKVIQLIGALSLVVLIGVLVFQNQLRAQSLQSESDAAKSNTVNLVKEKFVELNDKVDQLEGEKEGLEAENKELKQSQDQLRSVDKAIFLNDQNLVISYPASYVVREGDTGGYGQLSKFHFAVDSEELYMLVSISTSESVGQYAASYSENRGEAYCIDHGMCDEDFDPQNIIRGFNNLKSVTTGNGQQETIESYYYKFMNDAYFDVDENELKTINGRKFAIFNHSFVPSGEVWRNYVTFVGDTKVTISVLWELDRSIENIFHLHDADADEMVGKIFVKSV